MAHLKENGLKFMNMRVVILNQDGVLDLSVFICFATGSAGMDAPFFFERAIH